MNPEKSDNLLAQVIEKDKWSEILGFLVDVLRINIFITDRTGKTIIPPQMDRYGWSILSTHPVHFDLLNEEHSVFIDKFRRHGFYLEYNYQFDLHNFAVPLNIDENKAIAYIVIGPVILNKRLEKKEYQKIADSLKIDDNNLLEAINEMRVLSFVGIKSVLDLIDRIGNYILQLKLKELIFKKESLHHDLLPDEIRSKAQKLFATVYADEVLAHFLDSVLKVTRAQCGSVMLLDQRSQTLKIMASRGLDPQIAGKTRIKIGEGLSGTVADQRSSVIIHGTRCKNNRIQPFLKREDIKHAYVTPLVLNNKLIGILNLHTKSEEDIFNQHSIDSIDALSQLTSIAVNNLQ